MKPIFRIFSVVLGSLLLFGGTACHKSNAVAQEPKTLEQGLAELGTAMATANPEVQKSLTHDVRFNIRYGDYGKAELALQNIASDPSLNDQQKKAVNEVSDLLKQALEKQQNTAPPAH